MPRYGFNFQWMLVGDGARPQPTDERALDFLAACGFDFVRIPTNYRVWTTGFEYFEPDASVFEAIDGYLAACRARAIHLSLNLHRAPGYCITRSDLEATTCGSTRLPRMRSSSCGRVSPADISGCRATT